MTVLIDTGILYADHDTDVSGHEDASDALETVYDGEIVRTRLKHTRVVRPRPYKSHSGRSWSRLDQFRHHGRRSGEMSEIH